MASLPKMATFSILLLLGWYIFIAILRVQKFVPTPPTSVVTIVSILTLPLVALIPGYVKEQKKYYAVGVIVGVVVILYVASELARLPRLSPIQGLAPPIIHSILTAVFTVYSFLAYRR